MLLRSRFYTAISEQGGLGYECLDNRLIEGVNPGSGRVEAGSLSADRRRIGSDLGAKHGGIERVLLFRLLLLDLWGGRCWTCGFLQVNW